MTIFIDIYVQNWSIKHVSHSMLVTFILVTFCELTFVLMQHLSSTYSCTLGEFELVAARLAWFRTQSAKTAFYL